MKTSKLITAICWIIVTVFISSCDDSNEPTPSSQESTLTNNVLIGSNSAVSRLRSQGLAGPVGAVYGNFLKNSDRGRTQGSVATAMRNARGSNDTDSSNVTPTPSCLIEEWKDDGQGNYTYTLDFGDGCNYYGEFMKGKLVEKGSYSDNSFSSAVTYTNFGGSDWQVDGTYSYNGTWEETVLPDNGTSMPAEEEDSIWLYSATYNFDADITEQWTYYGYPDSVEVSTGETIVTVSYRANGSEKMDNNGYTVESQEESVSMSTGEAYTSQVDVPLFFDYSCEDVWIFVRGVESGTYTYNDVTTTYSINYGDGTCDNIITVTENGISEAIDLEEEWEDWEETCEGDHDEDESEDNESD